MSLHEPRSESAQGIPPPSITGFFTHGNTIRVLALADWLDMAAGAHPAVGVDLPMIQRGFVWKPKQIIDLWDSLLSGMPIGALMVSELQHNDARVALAQGSQAATAAQRLGLVDGQQRTLAMLTGWSAFAAGAGQRRLWVDLADEPAAGHRVRLRVSTRHQPFGYGRHEPNRKLSLDQRRRAREAYAAVAAQNLLAQARPHPAGAKYSAPVDLGQWVQAWRQLQDADAWKHALLQELQSVQTLAIEDGIAVLRAPWGDIPPAERTQILQRLDQLALGLQRIFATQIPLVRVDPALFQADSEDGTEPPLARLFQRIGSNATPLSDADYIYSILKHMMPRVHGMVERLHAHSRVAGLLTATDLVMSALRLAAVQWKDVLDHDNPSKDDFQRMVIRPKDGDPQQRQADMLALLGSAGPQVLQGYFDTVQKNLLYRGEGDAGLPALMLPCLGRPLVQVLLRLAQSGFLQDPVNEATRAQALRMVLWWMRWVWDKPKASRTAFDVIQNSTDHSDLDRQIAHAVVEAGAGMAMQPPAAIAGLGLHLSDTATLLGRQRFATPEDDSEKNRRTREFYRHWWQPWSHQHPMLLWLQRSYLNGLDAEPLAGMDEDTPYDFDHILPSAHWSPDWRIVGKSGTVEDFREARSVLGNSIGNIRVWDASHNRSDGDASPKEKRQRSDDPDQWMVWSAMDPSHAPHWIACSPAEGSKNTDWNRPRALAFQRAVELRAYALYQRLYDEAGFAPWERT